MTDDKPFKKNLPTDKSFIVVDRRDFNKEKERLIGVISNFSAVGTEAMNNRKHPFFGKLTATEWSTSMLKHLDHHLRQFGV